MKFQGTWLPDHKVFRRECLQIANNIGGKWANFKRNPIYCRYINNDNRDWATGLAFYAFIAEQYPEVLSRINDFKANDEIGTPTLHKIQGHIISPGTLRFMKVIGDVLKAFGSVGSVVEIGGGYGGQAKCFNVYGVDRYSIIDIPESAAIAQKYHEGSVVKIFSTGEDLSEFATEPSDLCISDYCLSELDSEGQDFYIDHVIKHCKYGYFTVNNPKSNDHLFSRLREFFRLEIKPEFPKTSKHENVIVYALKK